ncbi:MAG: hypothetical protein ABJC50_05445, partial [Nonlabens ulvanivorans]
DFKEYHLIILFGFTLIIVVIQIAQAIWVSKRIETFKNALKKSEIKFSRYNEMQIKILSESYQLLSDFNESTINVTYSELSPEVLNQRAKKWFEDYYNFQRHYSRNKFIFLSKTKVKLSVIFGTFEKMKSIVKMEQDRSKIHYTDESGDVQFVGDYQDLKKIYVELNKLNKNDTIRYTLSNIESLKKDIEEYFKNLEG